jgi:hypothetical protein
MFSDSTVLALYAEARRAEDLAPRRVAPVRPSRRTRPVAGLFAALKIVNTHKVVGTPARRARVGGA